MDDLLLSFCQTHGLLDPDAAVVRVPFLLRGQLVLPPALDAAAAARVFAALPEDARYAVTTGGQLLREPLIDRETRRETGQWRYLLLPPLEPLDLVETDFAQLEQLAALPTADVLAWLTEVSAALAQSALPPQVCELTRATSSLPDAWLEAAFLGLQLGLDPAAAGELIDAELGFWGVPGRELLDGWVPVAGKALPAIGALLGMAAGAPPPPDAPTLLRAMPTRQLHITAGNSPSVPLASALRAVLCKSPAAVKLPAEAIPAGALFLLAAALAAPDHPVTRSLSVVYWPGGDERVEQVLLAPGAFDRVVVWGAPRAVSSVQSRSIYTRVLSFNPRYGVSLIGRAAQQDLAATAALAAQDALVYNQQACNAALVHYVEGDHAAASAYAAALRDALLAWDRVAPNIVPPSAAGQVRRLRRGRYTNAEWLLNSAADGGFASGVLLLDGPFELLEHPLCRLVVVRPVADLAEVLPLLHAGVSTATIAPEDRRLALRDAVAVRGVSHVLPLGQAERLFGGMPHDGMVVLNQLVEWKTA